MAWAGLDAIRKRLAGHLSPLAILLGSSAAQLPLYAVWAGYAAWAGQLGLEDLRLDGDDLGPFVGWVILALLVLIAANVLLIRAVHLSPLSLTTPYLSFTPVATLASGALLLGQAPSAMGLAGVAVVVVGAFALSWSAAGPATAATTTTAVQAGADSGAAAAARAPGRGGAWAWVGSLAHERGSQLALVVAMLFALGNAIDRRAVLHASELVYAGSLMLVVTAVLLVPRGPRSEVWRERRLFRWLVLAGLVTMTALLLQLFAFRFLFVAYADAVKRAGGNIIAVAFGVWLFGEGDWRRRLVAVAIMSAGVAMILLGDR